MGTLRVHLAFNRTQARKTIRELHILRYRSLPLLRRYLCKTEVVTQEHKRDFKDLDLPHLDDYMMDSTNPIFHIKKKFKEESNTPASILYLSLRSFNLDADQWASELYDEYEYDFIYDIDTLSQWFYSEAANSLLTFLLHKRTNEIKIEKLRPDQVNLILRLAKIIPMNNTVPPEVNNAFLAVLGSHFQEYLIPTLLRYTKIFYRGLPSILLMVIHAIIILSVIGVILPIMLISLDIPIDIKEPITRIIVYVVTSFLFIFSMTFISILQREISP